MVTLHNLPVMSVGSGRVWDRVIVEKSAKRTFSCTVRPRGPCRCSRQPTRSVNSTSQARSTSRSLMSCSSVVSCEIDLASCCDQLGRPC